MTSGSREDRILERIRAIPEGLVRTYGDIEPDAPRLVGRILTAHHADGEPPDGVGIPWHRVVRADGNVPGGPAQLALLRLEAVPIRRDRIDLRHARMPTERDNARPEATR
jgi:alkylated DNA nucleotide flippase Atl1